ncbi:AAA family ATPase [Janthinobacterium rivuli]|uniref:AAA family ATPase n=1 Tax=Janthinobacterium rivuli TaxID=2751478 RepID=A0ABY8I4F8_9BURK|nr:AAA family ATPase [Janthinobacterium rivuli]WFR78998.1 AAA family ATPase [Janthinobacterium rivuli]
MEPILRSISLNNVRSISMDEEIRLAPITILVGKNSAGKSTFARSFPLIRQSCEAKKRAPILWFGDRADFGSFSETLKRGEEEHGIDFTFRINVVSEAKLNSRTMYRDSSVGNFEAKITINIKNSTVGRSYSPSISIQALGFDLELKVNELNNIESIICGRKRWKPKVTDYTDVSYQGILPILTIVRERTPAAQKTLFENAYPFREEIAKRVAREDFPFQDALLKAIYTTPIFERYTLASQICDRIDVLFKDFEEYARARVYEVVHDIEEMVFASKINDVLALLDDSLRTYYAGVKYIEPIRATAQRFYRKQELGIDEIDSKGENMAMFIDNMGPWLLEEFNEWIGKNFGFSVKTQSSGGHVAIVVREEGEDVYSNLADIGFGFSQILPVITQIWASQRRHTRSNQTSCIVIEQPELHLHPALQAKLADVFASVANGSMSTQLVIETHSNHLINRLGQIIGEGKLAYSDVQILLFSKNENGQSEITRSGFDEEGYLQNWPIGFFEPEW